MLFNPTIPNIGTLLGVWAHPDDEAYLSAGLIALVRRHGQRVVVVTATDGDAGQTAEGVETFAEWWSHEAFVDATIVLDVMARREDSTLLAEAVR